MSKPPVQGVTLARTIKWIEKTQGRDKFCKAIQYSCRFLKYRYEQKGEKQLAKKVGALFEGMKDARKLFRLFKSLNEFKKILDIVEKGDKPTDLVLKLITRVGFLLYWMFDNLAILSKIKVLSFDAKSIGKKGSTCWFIALFSTLILTIKDLFLISKKIMKIQKEIVEVSNVVKINKNFDEIVDIRKKQSELHRTLIKTLGDLIPAGQGSEIYPKVFGFNFHEGYCGLGGLVSALISTYQLYD